MWGLGAPLGIESAVKMTTLDSSLFERLGVLVKDSHILMWGCTL